MYQVRATQTSRAPATPPFQVFQNLQFRSVYFCTDGWRRHDHGTLFSFNFKLSIGGPKIFSIKDPGRLGIKDSGLVGTGVPGRVGTVNFLLFKYRIGANSHDRPASIGPLQVGYAADSWRFRIKLALVRSLESRRQTCHRTSRRAPRRLSGSALGPSSEACGAALR